MALSGAEHDVFSRGCCSHVLTTPLFMDVDGSPFSYDQLHRELRALLTGLFGAAFASAFSWHSVRIGLACALCAADAPDAVIQLICRWSSPDSLRVYRQMGIEKNVYWTNKAALTTFDATRVNNLPALDGMDHMREQIQAFGTADGPAAATPRRPLPSTPRATRTFTVPGGRVSAHSSDREGLVGLQVSVPGSFWSAADRSSDGRARYSCVVAAECARAFVHPDGEHCRTYLLECQGQYFPIKRAALLAVCLTAAQRDSLQPTVA